MSFGPNPWQQTSWDGRAAGNFIGGGSGSGLIVFGALSGAQGLALAAWMLGGLALVGAGLACVWLEIGRPLRALNVFRNPRTSWMAREALAANALVAAALAAAVGVPGTPLVAAVLAPVFVYCQGRMLGAARGIPAWRAPLLLPLMLASAGAEGGGLFWLVQPARVHEMPALWWLFGALLLARGLLWSGWRRQLAGQAAPAALAAVDHAGKVVRLAGTGLPLFIVLLAGTSLADAPLLVVVAGAAAFAGGAWFKFTLITRAGFNQGFALVRLPVRGVQR
jgi:phenylacetyl-CoA:acceptor oxidoreductase 26-kDa subunit